MDVSDFDNGARFVNKLWNASRFLFRYLEPDTKLTALKDLQLNLPNRWLLTEFAETVAKVNHHLEIYRLNDAVENIYHFIWGGFCDWALEAAKVDLNGTDEAKKQATLSVLVYVLDGALRLAHPIIPFVTEELWQHLPHHPDWTRTKSIVIAEFPDTKNVPQFPTDAANWQAVQALVTGIRSTRQQVEISPKEELKALVKSDAALAEVFRAATPWVMPLSNLSSLEVSSSAKRPDQSLVHVGKGYECYIPAAGLVDFEKEKARLSSEIGRIAKIVEGIEKKLSNESFVAKAPAEVVEQAQAQKANMESQVSGLKKSLAALS
jgi:valyl-tRNA synthetase